MVWHKNCSWKKRRICDNLLGSQPLIWGHHVYVVGKWSIIGWQNKINCQWTRHLPNNWIFEIQLASHILHILSKTGLRPSEVFYELAAPPDEWIAMQRYQPIREILGNRQRHVRGAGMQTVNNRQLNHLCVVRIFWENKEIQFSDEIRWLLLN